MWRSLKVEVMNQDAADCKQVNKDVEKRLKERGLGGRGSTKATTHKWLEFDLWLASHKQGNTTHTRLFFIVDI